MQPDPAQPTAQPDVDTLAVHRLDLADETDDGTPVVVAVHGLTGNALVWFALADELGVRHGAGLEVWAPDLSGRAESRGVPGPYGLDQHVSDVLDIVEALERPAVLVGHCLGAFVAARAAAAASEQVPRLVVGAVLVEGAMPLDPQARLSAPAPLGERFVSPQDYLERQRRLPELADVWTGPGEEVLEEYLMADLVKSDGALASSCVPGAVRVDEEQMRACNPTDDVDEARAAGLRIEMVRAEKGACLPVRPAASVTTVAGANHLSVVLAPAGVGAIADAVDRVLAAR